MLIRNKYFPYPVLSKDNTAYNSSSFNNDVITEVDGFNVKLTLTAFTNNEEINQLIKNKEISIVHHIECAQTCYREAIVTYDKQVVHSISQKRLVGLFKLIHF